MHYRSDVLAPTPARIGLIIIILYGFAVALFIGYGDETNVFSTLKGSFIAVIVAPAGGE